MKIIFIFLIALILPACYMGGPPPALPTIDGPEATDLLHDLKGFIMIDRPVGGIVAIELPTLKEMIIRKPWGEKEKEYKKSIHQFSGPDNKGRIVFLEDQWKEKNFSFKVMDMNTKNEDEIFTRTGSMWTFQKENYGESLSLSPKGGLVAFAANNRGVQMENPPALLEVGQLEIWNIDTKEKVQSGNIKILDNGLCWFPDGKRLALVQLISKSELGDNFLKKLVEDSIYKPYKNWNKIPVVSILDLKDNSIRIIDIGIEPVISPKGESVLMRSTINQNFYKLYTLARDGSIPINFSGQSYQVFSFITEDIILYRGYPTAGTEQKWRHTSTGGGIRMFSLKIAQLNTNRFVTILPSIDRWDRISFWKAVE